MRFFLFVISLFLPTIFGIKRVNPQAAYGSAQKDVEQLPTASVRQKTGTNGQSATKSADESAPECAISSETELEAIITSAMDAIITIDSQQRITRFNPAAEQLFGVAAADVIGQTLDRFIPWNYRTHHAEHIQQFGQTNTTNRKMGHLIPVVGLRSDGSSFPIEAAISQVHVGGKKLYTVILRDITTRMTAEAALHRSHTELEALVAERTAVLSAALEEKEILLKEVHHRVKNNLQIISSLLWLQAASLSDPASIAALRESQQRLKTMTLVHEMLYRNGDVAHIDASTYISELTHHLFQLFGADKMHIDLFVRATGILEMDYAIPCGLIVAEALSNSLKYAFPAGRHGTISISLTHDSQERLRLIVADDGVGLPEGMDIDRPHTLGMRLIRALATQLHGTLSITRSPGVNVTMSFPVPIHTAQSSTNKQRGA